MVKTFDDYVKKSKEIHGDKYEYISLKKIENVNFLEIKCSIHGIFDSGFFSWNLFLYAFLQSICCSI